MGTRRKMKVIFMGMGCSGINFAYQLQRKMENVELIIYERTTILAAPGWRTSIQDVLATSLASAINTAGSERAIGLSIIQDPVRFIVFFVVLQMNTTCSNMQSLTTR